VDVSPAAELVWIQTPGGEMCIDRRTLADKVESTLGHSVFATQRATEGAAIVQGRAGPDAAGRGWMAVVEVRRAGTPPLRRELLVNASDCRQLDEAIVLVVALLVDAASPTAPALIVTSQPPTSVSIGPDLAVAVGMLPGLAAGIGLAGEVRIGTFWPAAFWGHVWPGSEATRDTGAPVGTLQAYTFGVGIGPIYSQTAWELFACAGGSGGSVTSSGEGLSIPKTNMRPYVQAELRGGLRLRLIGSLFTRLDVGAGIPLLRYPYVYTPPGGPPNVPVFQALPVIPLAHLGLEIRAP
jgi:hypothetical protein